MGSPDAGKFTSEHDASFRRKVAINIAKGAAVVAIATGGVAGAKLIGDEVTGLNNPNANPDVVQQIESVAVGGAIEGLVLLLPAVYINELRKRLTIRMFF